jgi:hypothetical protein
MDDVLLNEFEEIVKKISSGTADAGVTNHFVEMLLEIKKKARDGNLNYMYRLGILYAIDASEEHVGALLGDLAFLEGERWLTKSCELGDPRGVDVLITIYSGKISRLLRDAAKVVSVERPDLIEGSKEMPIYTKEFMYEVYCRVFMKPPQGGGEVVEF